MSQSEQAYWSGLDLDLLSEPANSRGMSGSVPIIDKRARHTMVERNRRDKTRAFAEQLQSMLPNITDCRQNPNLNFILDKTLEYLQSETNNPLVSADDMELGLPSNADRIHTHIANGIRYHIDDFSKRRNMFTFDNAPFGIVIARSDGVLLRVNDYFRNMFFIPHGPLAGHTMFTLTSSRDLPVTMKVRIKSM